MRLTTEKLDGQTKDQVIARGAFGILDKRTLEGK